ncbi:unnamed protein product, partial [Thlaspi arvense]
QLLTPTEISDSGLPLFSKFLRASLLLFSFSVNLQVVEKSRSICGRKMKIQCDVCEKAPATLICCADEAALCAKCDLEVHAANKLASKHQRLLLQCLSNKLPPCDICQEKPAFIFCVEDRALFCQDCDEPIHAASSLSAKHQRFLATGIRVAVNSSCTKTSEKSHQEPNPPNQSAQKIAMKMPTPNLLA